MLNSITNAFKSLFGKGTLVYDAVISTGTEQYGVEAKVPYVGNVNTRDDEELRKQLQQELPLGHCVTSFKFKEIRK